MDPAIPSVTHGRWCIALAAVLWSTSGAFTKLLTQDTFLGLNEPRLGGLTIAFGRVFFAGLVLLPTLRKSDISWRGMMLLSAFSFAVMNILFISAMNLGTAANAILLQYTAPIWMYLASVLWLGEKATRRGAVSLAIGMAGIAVIVAGTWEGGQLPIVALALGSGVGYAGVLICLRVLRNQSSRWLTVWNHLCGAAAIVPLFFLWPEAEPTPVQCSVLVLFGALQMGLPYWLVARGLRSVSPHEAGAITLLEPVLNPLWAYLIAPQTETPAVATFMGGALILAGLAWQYRTG
jgi:DME family drug/metabolite transporter